VNRRCGLFDAKAGKLDGAKLLAQRSESMRSIMLPIMRYGMNGVVMLNTDASQNKVARARARMRNAGLRPVQFWVPDTRSSLLVDELRRQCLALKGTHAERDAVGFSEQAAALVEGWA
jgi:hypothetical protein